MLALLKAGQGIGLELATVPVPRPGPYDVLLKVRAMAICGSDLPIFYWDDPWTRKTVKPGQIIGHEFCGEIVEVGSEVTGVELGSLATAEGHIHCGSCFHCRTNMAHLCPRQQLIGFDYPGGFAEFISVPASNLVQLDGSLPLHVAAIHDPFGNAVHAASKVRVTNRTVLVTGCGTLGLMSVALARHSGAAIIVATDTSPVRLRLARQLGADYTLNPGQDDVDSLVEELTSATSGVDILLEMSGSSDAIAQGFHLLRPGGEAVLMGLPKEPVEFDFANELVAKGVTVHGLVGRELFGTWQELQIYVANPSIRSALSTIVTHRFALHEYQRAFELMKSAACGKIVLYPSEELADSNE